MGGFLSLFDQTDRVELGGGYYVEVTRFLSDSAAARAQRALVAPQMQSKVAQGAEAQEVTTTIDQGAYHLELMVAGIVAWNLTDANGVDLPLPPYVPASPSGPDLANRVRRESIQRLPAFATSRIAAKIVENEQKGIDDEAFQGPGEGAPAAS